MMFKCQSCGLSSRQPFSYVPQTRSVSYTHTIVSVDRKHEKQINTTGCEIAVEMKVCAACLNRLQSQARQVINTGKRVWHTQQQKH